ncbi:hypothetical protein EE612_008775 [Oryza sativa]|nr:hypothetical protein EE612_008775 [Oryza sativa]
MERRWEALRKGGDNPSEGVAAQTL